MLAFLSECLSKCACKWTSTRWVQHLPTSGCTSTLLWVAFYHIQFGRPDYGRGIGGGFWSCRVSQSTWLHHHCTFHRSSVSGGESHSALPPTRAQSRDQSLEHKLKISCVESLTVFGSIVLVKGHKDSDQTIMCLLFVPRLIIAHEVLHCSLQFD